MSIAIARAAAKKILIQSGLVPPLDLEELLRWRGIELVLAMDWSSSLCARYDSVFQRIEVNRSHVRVRQRFSIAHELGHCLLGHEQVEIDHGVSSIFGDEEESFDVAGDLEREANAFATEILMPKAWVMAHAGGLSTQDVTRLLQVQCEVSQPAAWYRVMELRIAGFAPTRRRKR